MQIKFGRNILMSIVLLTSIILTTIVYSAFNTQLQIEGEAIVRSDQNIRITNIRISSTSNGAYETYNNKYNKDTTFMYATLPSNSSITYELEITNKDSISYLIDSIIEQSNTNENVSVSISLNENDIINSNSSNAFTITITNNTEEEQIETLIYKYEFKENNFTVTFDANGGSVSTSSKEVSYGSTYGELPTPTREGYTFLGWHGKNLYHTDMLIDNIIINYNGSISDNSWWKGTNFIEVKSNTTYYFSCDTNEKIQFRYLLYDENKNYIDSNYTNVVPTNNKFSISFNTTSNSKYIRVTFNYRIHTFDDVVERNNIQIKEENAVSSYEPYYITSNTTVVQPNNHTLKAMWVTELSNNKVEYVYTGDYQEFIAPTSGTYKIELWGASGGNINSETDGNGGYVSGNITLYEQQKMYIYVGSMGVAVKGNQTINGGYNGGGSGKNDTYQSSLNRYFSSGGGATDIRLVSGNWNNFDSLKSRIMVAAGGGGSFIGNITYYGGYAGGLKGANGTYDEIGYGTGGTGGTQISPGYYICDEDTCSHYTSGQSINNKGVGGFGYGGSYSPLTHSGGGSGYYGGGGSTHVQSGGGGSSFISGHDGCDAIDKESTEENIIHTGQSVHYSGYAFTDTIMIDGGGCSWTTEASTTCTGQIQPDGTTITGHTGNGYARITLIE